MNILHGKSKNSSTTKPKSNKARLDKARPQIAKPRHFLDLGDFTATQLRELVDLAHAMKKAGRHKMPGGVSHLGQTEGPVTLALIFEKPSTRTRLSFDMAMRQLGGETTILNASDMQLGRGETIADTARVLSRFVDAIMLRANSHDDLLELARHAEIPVINGLTGFSHPCQIMADIQTYEEHCGPIEEARIAWIGDGNNVAVSWIHAAEKFGFELTLACPGELSPDAELLSRAGDNIILTQDPEQAAGDADCVVTDTWVSMGDEDAEWRMKILSPYQVDEKLMQKAAPKAIFMHCLPAHRGEEVTASVIDGPQSVVFDEAENRLHAQKAVLAWCLKLCDLSA